MKTNSTLGILFLLPMAALAQVTPVAPPSAPSSVAPAMSASAPTREETLPPKAEPVLHTPENARPGPALSVLDPVTTSSGILAWMFDAREPQAAGLEMRLEATGRAVEALKISAGDYRSEPAFRAASLAVGAAEDQLKRSVKAARQATAEKWGDARAKVSSDFKAYSDAVTRLEGLVAANALPNV